jgi:PKHD-type hydroxylase
MVRGESERTLLYDLDQSVQRLAAIHGSDHCEVVSLTGHYHNLIRLWADT